MVVVVLTGQARRDYQRQWVAQRRAKWLADKACADCGTTKNLTIDHIDRTTKVSHNIWSWSAKRRDAELAKCQVLCLSCHERKSKLAGDKAQPGERNGHAKLVAAEVLAIRASSSTDIDLARRFGVSPPTIRDIRTRRRWKHI